MLERFEILLSSVLVESDVLTFERLTPGRHRERRARGLCSSTMRVLLLLLCLVCRRVPGFRPPPRIPTSWRLASSPSEDLYEALGVPSTADDSMLRRAYVKRAKLLHPDVNPSPEAATDFRRIAEAYEVLRDERKRKRYDNERFAEKVSESAGAAADDFVENVAVPLVRDVAVPLANVTVQMGAAGAVEAAKVLRKVPPGAAVAAAAGMLFAGPVAAVAAGMGAAAMSTAPSSEQAERTAQRKKDAEARREARKWAAEQRREAMGPAKSDAELESEAKDFAGRLWGALTPGASDLSRDQGGDATDAEYSDYSEDAAATAIGAATGQVVTWDFNSKMDDGGAAVAEESELEENEAERLADEAFFALSTSAESMDPIITDDSDDDELSTLSSATATSVVNQVKRGRGKRNKKPKKARGFGPSPQEPRGTDKASGSRPGPTANVWKRHGFDASIQKESWHRAYDENSKAGFPDSRLG